MDYPQHIAVVMDGNGRWAEQRGLPRALGHREGSKSVRRAVEFCIKNQVKILTLFALSTENKKLRPKSEVNYLLSLFLQSLQKETVALHEQGVRIRIIGDISGLGHKLVKQIKASEQRTSNNQALELVIAINYSGRWDLTSAAKQLAADVRADLIRLDDVDESVFGQYVQLQDLSEPDLLIRSGGEQRISNFLLWQLAYTEIYFSDAFWPDFNSVLFEQAINCYLTRERRYGTIKQKISCDNHA